MRRFVLGGKQLGYTVGLAWSWRQRRLVRNTIPSQEAVKRLKAKISELTATHNRLIDVDYQVGRLNRMLQGGANYFCRGPVSKAYRLIDEHVANRFRQWLGGKHKHQGLRHDLYPHAYLHGEWDLLQLTAKPRNGSWAKA